MSGRDGDTTEFPAVGALPGGRQPTHVIGPLALGTRDAATELTPTEMLGGATGGAAPGGEPRAVGRRVVLGLVGAAVVVLVGAGGVAVGATLDGGTSSTPAAGVTTSTEEPAQDLADGRETGTSAAPTAGAVPDAPTGTSADEAPAAGGAGPAGRGPVADGGPGTAEPGAGGPAGPAAGGPGAGGPRG